MESIREFEWREEIARVERRTDVVEISMCGEKAVGETAGDNVVLGCTNGCYTFRTSLRETSS